MRKVEKRKGRIERHIWKRNYKEMYNLTENGEFLAETYLFTAQIFDSFSPQCIECYV
jgi:hypothetical protein